MKHRELIWCILAILVLLSAAVLVNAAEKPLDVLNMTEIPAGNYDVQLQESGKKETVKLAIKGDRASFLKSTSPKFEGLSGSFEHLGNGVFVARLSCNAGNVTQLWLFRPDGTAKVKESPDRGENQVAKLAAD